MQAAQNVINVGLVCKEFYHFSTSTGVHSAALAALCKVRNDGCSCTGMQALKEAVLALPGRRHAGGFGDADCCTSDPMSLDLTQLRAACTALGTRKTGECMPSCPCLTQRDHRC